MGASKSPPSSQKCAKCGESNQSGARFCESCGQPLETRLKTEYAPPPKPKDRKTRQEKSGSPSREPPEPPEKPAPGTVLLPISKGIQLIFENAAVLTLKDEAEYYVGRSDSMNGWNPAVDLTSHGGEPGGVSRRHARFLLKRDEFHLEDLGSKNGTFINGQKLAADDSKQLNDGDRIAFGRIEVTYREKR